MKTSIRKREIQSLLFISTAFLLSCGGGGGGGGSGGGEAISPSSCKPFSSGSAPVSTWSIAKNSSVYDIQLTVDRNKLNQFKSSNSGCSVTSYELSLVGGNKYIVFDSDPRPTVIDGWDTIGFSNSYTYNSLSLSSYTDVSLCFRAFSNLGEESSWYCSSKTVPTGSGTPTPTPTPTPTDTTPPSTPSNLSISAYWSVGTTVYLNFTGSTDAQSGVSKYWTAILDSSMNQVSPDKQLSSYSTSDSFNTSTLTAGRTYYYAIIAENGAGLYSSIATVQFYKPVQVTVYIKYYSMGAGGCNYPTTYSCQSAAKTMFDTQLATLKSTQYPSCTLTSLGANTYELNCRTAQTCQVNPIGGYCGGMPATTYSGYCSAVHGTYVSGTCGGSSWNPTLPSP